MDYNATEQIPCSHCGRLIAANSSFCNFCGNTMQPPAPGSAYPPPAYYPPPARRGGLHPACIIAIILVVLLPVFGILLAIALPNYIKVKEKAKEAETKADLHNIQLAAERFAIDSGGEYPPYLIGGAAQYADEIRQNDVDDSFHGIKDCPNPTLVSDPLLRGGYLTNYPRNPFVRSGITIHVVQGNLPSAQTGDDPLRNDCEDGVERGTRFGPECNLMGSVLADPRFAEFTVTNPATGAEVTEPTWADVEYQFWDMWVGDKPLPFLPGQFFYKSAGPVVSRGLELRTGDNLIDLSLDSPDAPESIAHYILGAYGGIRDKGKDVIGAETPVMYTANHPVRTADDVPVKFWLWTRSQVSADLTDLAGSPYMPNPNGDLDDPVQYGNPNGIRDAIVLVLTDGI